MKALEKELDELNQKDAKLKAASNALQQQILSEQRKLKTLQKNIKIDETALVKKEDQMTKVKALPDFQSHQCFLNFYLSGC